MDILVGVGSVVLYAAMIGLLMTGSRRRRALLMAFATAMLAVPFLVRDSPYLTTTGRAFIGLGFAGTYVRFVDLAKERGLPVSRRLLHATMMMELRRTPRVAPCFDAKAFVRMLSFGVVAAVAFSILARVPETDTASQAIRYLAGLVACYTMIDAFAAFAKLLWTGIGFALPVVHDDPIKSRSVAEFWGERWNRIVSGWLREHVFMPLARRRHPRLGLAMAFVASAILHVYIAWATLDAHAGLLWGIFFLLQIPIVFIERKLRIATWRPVWAHAWTAFALLVTSPLFVLPVITAFG